MKYHDVHDSYFASIPGGLELPLEKELKNLKITHYQVVRGGIIFKTSFEKVQNFLLTTRVAGKVYKKLHTSSIKNKKDLYNEIYDLDWTKIFAVDKSFKISTILGKQTNRQASSPFNNSLHISQITKDAIADRFRKEIDKRPFVDTRSPEVPILLYLSPSEKSEKQTQLEVYVDLSGWPLGNRHYRKQEFSAPFKENLAAGLLSLMEWDPKNEIFIDSMCGSGTMIVEALMLKANIPPQFLTIKNRIENKNLSIPWSMEHLKFFQKNGDLNKNWNRLIKEKYDQYKKGIEFLKKSEISVFGHDIDPNAVKQTKENLETLSFLDFSNIKKSDSTLLKPSHNQEGTIFCNPPYGDRIGDIEKLERLYYLYGENLKNNFKGYKAFIFTGNFELRKKIHLQTSKRISVYNGNIECRLLRYNLY